MTLTQVAATILSFIALTASLEVCPTGFSLTSLRDHSLCLYPSSTPHNKKNAETFCHNLGGALFVAREGSDIPFQNTKIESSASHLWVNTDHTESYNTARGPDVNFTEVYHKQANEEEAGQRASCWSLQRGVLTATDCSNEHKALCSAVPVISQDAFSALDPQVMAAQSTAAHPALMSQNLLSSDASNEPHKTLLAVSDPPSAKPTSEPTIKPTANPVLPPTARPSAAPTVRPTRAPTAKPTARPSIRPSTRPTPVPTIRPTDKPTKEPTCRPTAAPVINPTARPSSEPTLKPSSRPTTIPTTKPSAEPTCRPTAQPVISPTARPSSEPTLRPTVNPSARPSAKPSAEPTFRPTAAPIVTPTARPTLVPSQRPTTVPTIIPTAKPSAEPTIRPSTAPVVTPTARPSSEPTLRPTAAPSARPTTKPTSAPTIRPSPAPISTPTVRPTSEPTYRPTPRPISSPTTKPTAEPTVRPSAAPISTPTARPTSEPTFRPTARPSSEPTARPSSAPTFSPSAAPIIPPSARPSVESTLNPTRAPIIPPSARPTIEPTPRPSASPIIAPTARPTRDPTRQPTRNPTIIPTARPTKEPTCRPTGIPTAPPTAPPTAIPTASPSTPTANPSISLDPSIKPTIRPTSDPTARPSRVPTARPSARPTVLPTERPTRIPTAPPSARPTAEPSAPTALPTEMPTAQPTDESPPTFAPTNEPTVVPTMVPTAPTQDPTQEPSAVPTMLPTPVPTAEPSISLDPTIIPTARPSGEPTERPTRVPTIIPTARPSSEPTLRPTAQPSAGPTPRPSSEPTARPTRIPTSIPTARPTAAPSMPTAPPTEIPTAGPTEEQPPTFVPTCDPSMVPSAMPSAPTAPPTVDPTANPSAAPTFQPTAEPTTSAPTADPTMNPTAEPSMNPTMMPTAEPTFRPTRMPTVMPTARPTAQPTFKPTSEPSKIPTARPSAVPTFKPTSEPTERPTARPSSAPTFKPTARPSEIPTPRPTSIPTFLPTASPSAAPTTSPTYTAGPSAPPTFSPTARPTAQPSAMPTAVPTAAPSSAPTRVPTAIPTFSSCPKGTHYLNTSLATTCLDCSVGRYGPATGLAECKLCPIGRYADNPGYTSCLPCAAGRYANVPETVDCSVCTAGTYANGTGNTACEVCPVGYKSSDGASTCGACGYGWVAGQEKSSVCTECTSGTYSDVVDGAECKQAPAGGYVNGDGRGGYSLCPIGTYSTDVAATSEDTCVQCPSNRITTSTGSAQSDSCFAPATNFILAAVALLVVGVVSMIYIIGGRMNAIAYGRMSFIANAKEQYKLLIASVAKMEKIASEKPLPDTKQEDAAKQGWCNGTVGGWFLAEVLLFVIGTVVLTIFTYGKIFIYAVVIWRNVHIQFPNLNLLHQLQSVLSDLQTYLGFRVALLFYWAIYLCDWFARIPINLSFAEVTCPGAQAPILLLIDVIICVRVVCLIDSDMAAILETTFGEAHAAYRRALVNPALSEQISYSFKYKMWLWFLSFVESSLVSSSIVTVVLQLVLGFVTLGPFYKNGVHKSSVACDSVHGLPYYDTTMAISASVLFYVLILPVLYNMSKLLVPRLNEKRSKKNLNTEEGRAATNAKEEVLNATADEVERDCLCGTKCVANAFDGDSTMPIFRWLQSDDAWLSWRFNWAFNVLNMKKDAKPGMPEEKVFPLPEDANEGEELTTPAHIGPTWKLFKMMKGRNRRCGCLTCYFTAPEVRKQEADVQAQWEEEKLRRLPSLLIAAREVYDDHGKLWKYTKILGENLVSTFAVYGLGYWYGTSEMTFAIEEFLDNSGVEGMNAIDAQEENTPENDRIKDGDSFRMTVASALHAKLVTRATVCLLFTYGAFITTYVSSTASFPLLCTSQYLNKRLPQMLVWDEARKFAAQRVRNMGNYAEWKVNLLSWYITITESRVIRWLYGMLQYIMTLSILFFPSKGFLIFGAVMIALYNAVSMLYLMVVVGNMFGIKDPVVADAGAAGGAAGAAGVTDVESATAADRGLDLQPLGSSKRTPVAAAAAMAQGSHKNTLSQCRSFRGSGLYIPVAGADAPALDFDDGDEHDLRNPELLSIYDKEDEVPDLALERK